MNADDNLEEFTAPANYDLEQRPPSRARIEFWRRMAAQFGDWDFAPFRARGERLVTLARRRG